MDSASDLQLGPEKELGSWEPQGNWTQLDGMDPNMMPGSDSDNQVQEEEEDEDKEDDKDKEDDGRPQKSEEGSDTPVLEAEKQPVEKQDLSLTPRDCTMEIEEGIQKKGYKQRERKRKHGDTPIKSIDMQVDSKVIYAISDLFLESVSSLMPPQQGGSIKCHPNFSKKIIRIIYYEEKVGLEVEKQINDFIEGMEFVQVEDAVGECGIQFSESYRCKLKKEGMGIIANFSNKKKRGTYFICGKKSPLALLEQVSLLKRKKVSFSWLRLFCYRNTRSYNIILSKLFELQEVKELVSEKFGAKNIEVGRVMRCLPVGKKGEEKGVLCVLTFSGEKKLMVHQEVEDCLRTHIRKNYWLFCFTYLRENNKKQSWAPKMANSLFFFIHQHKIPIPLSYLFVLLTKTELTTRKHLIIQEIEAMTKVRITGRRFFEGFEPSQNHPSNLNLNLMSADFPSHRPYSHSVWAKKGEQFRWQQAFDL